MPERFGVLLSVCARGNFSWDNLRTEVNGNEKKDKNLPSVEVGRIHSFPSGLVYLELCVEGEHGDQLGKETPLFVGRVLLVEGAVEGADDGVSVIQHHHEETPREQHAREVDEEQQQAVEVVQQQWVQGLRNNKWHSL